MNDILFSKWIFHWFHWTNRNNVTPCLILKQFGKTIKYRLFKLAALVSYQVDMATSSFGCLRTQSYRFQPSLSSVITLERSSGWTAVLPIEERHGHCLRSSVMVDFDQRVLNQEWQSYDLGIIFIAPLRYLLQFIGLLSRHSCEK